MLNSDQLTPVTAESFRELIATLLTDQAVPSSLADQVKHFKQLKSELGRKQMADRLGISTDELSFFAAAVAAVSPDRSSSSQSEKNQVLALLRLSSWLETIASRRNEYELSPQVEALVSEELSRKRIRALELVIRSLIGERHGDQRELTDHLRSVFGDKAVDNWSKVADANDLLSGTTFSELASIFVNKEEFSHHQRLYDDADVLTLLKERRTTVQSFLEDIRRTRNTLAHNKKISNVQLSLLDLYYDELISPVDAAHRRGETQVNPESYLKVSDSDLDGYFDNLRDDVMSVKADVADLKDGIHQRFSAVQDQAARIETATGGINKKLLAVLGALLVVVCGVGYVVQQGQGTQESLSDLQDSTSAVQQDTEAIDSKTDALVDSGERIELKADLLLDSNKQIIHSLETIRDGFDSLSKAGGIITNPQLPQEVYHNARAYEQKGDYANARRSYVRFLGFNLDLLDPHLRFQTFLKLQEGRAGAREIYQELASQSTSFVTKFANILLQDPAQRIQQLGSFADEHPEFAPAYYHLSREYSQSRLGEQAMTDKAAEYENLLKFLELHEQGQYLKFMLDQEMANTQLTDARERLEPLKSIRAETMQNPVTISGMRTSSEWRLTVQVSGKVKEIFLRQDGTGEFKSTGHVQFNDPQTGFPMPNPLVNVDKNITNTVFEVKFTDTRDREHGPFTIAFDPEKELFVSQKKMLEQTSARWASFRDFDGKTLVYFSTLIAGRNAIDAIYYGLDKEQPDTKYLIARLTKTGAVYHQIEFGPGDPDRPGELVTDENNYGEWPIFTVPSTTKFITIQLKYKDGTESEIRRFKR